MPSDNGSGSNAPHRRPGLRLLGQNIRKLTDRAIRKRGFVEAAIIHNWAAIVGADVATWCAPDKVTFPRDRRFGATLHLLVQGSRALEVQHLEPVLLERLNTVFGYAALSKIAIRQAPVTDIGKSAGKLQRPLKEDEERWVAEQVAELGESDLKSALEALGRAVISNRG